MNQKQFEASCERFVARFGDLMRAQIICCRDQFPSKQGPYAALLVDRPSDTISFVLSARLSDGGYSSRVIEEVAEGVVAFLREINGQEGVDVTHMWDGKGHVRG